MHCEEEDADLGGEAWLKKKLRSKIKIIITHQNFDFDIEFSILDLILVAKIVFKKSQIIFSHPVWISFRDLQIWIQRHRFALHIFFHIEIQIFYQNLDFELGTRPTDSKKSNAQRSICLWRQRLFYRSASSVKSWTWKRSTWSNRTRRCHFLRSLIWRISIFPLDPLLAIWIRGLDSIPYIRLLSIPDLLLAVVITGPTSELACPKIRNGT